MTLVEDTIRICSGNQMVAEGALQAGAQFFAGYPITPASGIYKTMMEELPKRNGVAISAPDEISALAFCVGASARGAKAMTATSGPGWCLMIETIQYALMTELPVVVAVVQRLGPSTGGATQGGQGDLLLTEFCTSGGYTIPVFAPSTPQECFELATAAFFWAESLRSPVILLLDKEVGMTSEDITMGELRSFPFMYRKEFNSQKSDESAYRTYHFERLDDVPLFSPVGGKHKVTMTGSAHDKSGRLQKNSSETLEVLRHLQAKVDAREEEIELVRSYGEADAESVVLSFGITARTAKEAVRIGRSRGMKVKAVNVLSLFPIPRKSLATETKNARTIVIAEENLTGQYRSVLQPLLSGKHVVSVNSLGRMISPREIINAFSS